MAPAPPGEIHLDYSKLVAEVELEEAGILGEVRTRCHVRKNCLGSEPYWMVQ